MMKKSRFIFELCCACAQKTSYLKSSIRFSYFVPEKASVQTNNSCRIYDQNHSITIVAGEYSCFTQYGLVVAIWLFYGCGFEIGFFVAHGQLVSCWGFVGFLAWRWFYGCIYGIVYMRLYEKHPGRKT